MNVLSFDKQIRAISALVEGCSIRGTERHCGVNRETVAGLSLTVGEACQRLHDALMRDVNVDLLEVDELHGYVAKKQRHRRSADPADFGDQWTYLGLDAISKAIVGFRTGKRTQETTDAFALDLRARILNQPQITSDGYTPYAAAVAKAFGAEADFAMIIKEGYFYDDDLRSSTGPVIIHLTGHPDPAYITTNHNERQNLNLRMGSRRFMRKTNGFSKKLRQHCAAVALYVAHSNFCRVHARLKVSPAVALGVADRVWTVGDLIEAALSIAPVWEPVSSPAQEPPPRERVVVALPAATPEGAALAPAPPASAPQDPVEQPEAWPAPTARRIALRVPAALHMELKVKTARLGMRMTDFVSEALATLATRAGAVPGPKRGQRRGPQKRLAVNVPAPLHAELKAKAAELGLSLEGLIIGALLEKGEEHKEPEPVGASRS